MPKLVINVKDKIEEEIMKRVGAEGKFFNVINQSFLSNKEKNLVTNILKLATFCLLNASIKKYKIISVEIRFLWKIADKSNRDQIHNKIFIEELGIKLVEVTVQKRQLKEYGHVERIEEERVTEHVFKVTKKGKE